MRERSIIHLNIVGFKCAVAAVNDKSLQGRPYVIAGTTGGRTVAFDCSPEAVKQGITRGMALDSAERKVKDLTVLPPDPPAYETVNKELNRIAAQYAPEWENDSAGNLYLDISGTSGLFGPPLDCSSRIFKDIKAHTDIKPVIAVAANKLVSKVATRTIRPTGLIQVQAGTEAEFMAHQDIRILPGMGPGLLRTAAVTGIREAGEIASLSVPEAMSLFGKHGSLLRNYALGIDDSQVKEQRGERRIWQRADFEEDIIEETHIHGALEALAEQGGLEMRRDKLGTKALRLIVIYYDSVEAQGTNKSKRLLVTDREITASAFSLFKRTVNRRIRIRSVGLCLEDLAPLSYEPDLFEPEADIKYRRLQEAVDKIQIRYGVGSVTTGLVLAASGSINHSHNPVKRKPSLPTPLQLRPINRKTYKLQER
jgi:DNA polymerase-4